MGRVFDRIPGYSLYLELLGEAVVSTYETGATADEIASNNYIGIFADEAAAESQRKGYDKTTATNLISGLSTGESGISSLSSLTAEQKTLKLPASELNDRCCLQQRTIHFKHETSISNAAGAQGLMMALALQTSTGSAVGSNTSSVIHPAVATFL